MSSMITTTRRTQKNSSPMPPKRQRWTSRRHARSGPSPTESDASFLYWENRLTFSKVDTMGKDQRISLRLRRMFLWPLQLTHSTGLNPLMRSYQGTKTFPLGTPVAALPCRLESCDSTADCDGRRGSLCCCRCAACYTYFART